MLLQTSYSNVSDLERTSDSDRYFSSWYCRELSVDNMAYLNSKQALADTAQFIGYCKDWYSMPNASVIVFGGSIAGTK